MRNIKRADYEETSIAHVVNGWVGRAFQEEVDDRYDRQFAILHAVSDNHFKRMNITSTRKLVDYQPQDDGFEILQSGIRCRERWYRENERCLK